MDAERLGAHCIVNYSVDADGRPDGAAGGASRGQALPSDIAKIVNAVVGQQSF